MENKLPDNYTFKKFFVHNDDYYLREERYAIVDKNTGEIIDDAQGYGFKSIEKAVKCALFKNSMAKGEKMKKKITAFLKKNPNFDDLLEDMALEAFKEGRELKITDISDAADRMELLLPCSPEHFLRFLQK